MTSVNDLKKVPQRICEVWKLPKFILILHFKSGEKRLIDLEPLIFNSNGSLITPLRDPAEFQKVKCNGRTIYWPNGLELDPNVLYAKSTQIERTYVRNIPKSKPKVAVNFRVNSPISKKNPQKVYK